MSKISALPELTTPANDDEIEIVDKSDTSQAASGTNKRIQKSNLLTGATPAAHATTHQNGGADEVSIAGLSGVLADAQVANKVVETSGPTTLNIGDIVDGEFLKRVGSEIVSDTVSPGGGSPGGADGDIQYRVDASTFGGTSIKRDSANAYSIQNGINGQSLSVFKTTTNGYKFTITNTSNAWKLKSESSSGTPDPVHILAGHATEFWGFSQTNFLPPGDAVQNLGSLGQRFLQGFINELFVGSAGTISFGTSSTKLKAAGNGILDIQTENSNVGGTIRFVPTTAAQITADQNNYSSGGISKYQRWSSDASRNVTGFVTSPAQVTGQEHVITNIGSNNIVLVNESGSSTAANRFTTNTGTDITLGANEMVLIWYDGTTSRWRVAKL